MTQQTKQMKSPLTPSPERLVVRLLKPEELTVNGIQLPEHTFSNQWEVLAVGENVDMILKAKDRIFINNGAVIKLVNGEYYIVKQEDILALLNE